jgi:hypothetical protein
MSYYGSDKAEHSETLRVWQQQQFFQWQVSKRDEELLQLLELCDDNPSRYLLAACTKARGLLHALIPAAGKDKEKNAAIEAYIHRVTDIKAAAYRLERLPNNRAAADKKGKEQVRLKEALWNLYREQKAFQQNEGGLYFEDSGDLGEIALQ